MSKNEKMYAPRVVDTERELNALAVGSLVHSGGEVFERIEHDGPERIWRCLHDAKDYREYENYPSFVVRAQQADPIRVLYVPEVFSREHER